MKKYYPWVICIIGLFMHFCAAGLVASVLSVYLPFFRSIIGLTNTQTSMINTIRCLSTVVAMLFAGRYYRKLSLRFGIVGALLCLIAGCLLFAHAKTAMVCYIAAVLFGISYAYGSMLPIALLIRNWFQEQYATAISICACGSGFCSLVAPTIVTKMIETRGLNFTFTVEAIIVLGFAIIFFLLIRDNPKDIGLSPYQTEVRKETPKEKEKKKDHHSVVVCNLTSREMVVFMSAIFLVGFLGSPAVANLAIHVRTAGYSSTQAAFAVSLNGIMLIIGKLAFGAGADCFGSKRVNTLFFVTLALACGLMAIISGDALPMYMAVFLFGFGLTVGTVGISLWVADLSSTEDYAKNVRSSQTIFSVGSLVGSPVPGIIADINGSYSHVYLLYAVLCILVLVMIQAIYKKHTAYAVVC